MMFRLIGGAVVYGFALYGVAAFLDRPRVRVFLSEGGRGRKPQGEAPGGEKDTTEADAAGCRVPGS